MGILENWIEKENSFEQRVKEVVIKNYPASVYKSTSGGGFKDVQDQVPVFGGAQGATTGQELLNENSRHFMVMGVTRWGGSSIVK